MKTITSIIVLILTGISVFGQFSVEYTFDKHGWLKSEHIAGVYQLQFAYDKEGNIQSKTLADYTSIDKPEKPIILSQVRMHPNPASDHFIIEVQGESKVLNVNICDVSGKVIQQIRNPEVPVFISVLHLKNGLYFLEVETESKTAVFKLIKN